MRHTVAIQFFQVGSIPFAENIVDMRDMWDEENMLIYASNYVRDM